MIVSHGEIPRDHLAALGSVAVASARLEDALTAVLAGAVGGNVDGVMALLSSDSLNAKVDKLRLLASRQIRINDERTAGALNRVVDDDQAAQLAALGQLCDQARVGRNRMIHSVWGLNPEGDVVLTRLRTSSSLTLEQAITPAAEVYAVAAHLEEAYQATLAVTFDQIGRRSPGSG